MKNYYIYILTNKSNGVLYTGITGNLIMRIWQHREKQDDGFTSKYNANKLVYYEIHNDPEVAIMREKQIKAGSRKKKIRIIVLKNPEWEDLYPEIASLI